MDAESNSIPLRAGQQEQVNTTIDQILETFLKDAETKGGVCPLWGHSKEVLTRIAGPS
jgi:hypothetical protein